MADEIDAGRIVAEIVLETQQARENAEKMKEELDEIGAKTVNPTIKPKLDKNIENSYEELKKMFSENIAPTIKPQIDTSLIENSYEDTLEYIGEVLENLGIKGKEAEKIIKACFQDVDILKKYQNNLQILASKLEVAKKHYQELEQAKLSAEKQNNVSEVDKLTTAMEKQSITMKSLEAQFDNTYTQMDSTVKRTVTNYQKQINAGQKANKNFASSVNLATTSLRTFNSIAPDTVDGIGEIITQVNATKQAMTAGASAPIAWGTAIIAGIGIVANLVINEIQKVQQAEEEARQKATEAVSKYTNNSEELSNLTEQFASLRSKLDNVNLSRQEEIEVKKELYQMQDDFIKKYGLEADAIDFVTGSIKEQTAAIEERKKAEALELISKSDNEYRKYKDEFENKQRYTISALKTFDGISELGNISYDKLQEISNELNKKLSKIGGVQSEIITKRINGQLTGEKELVINVDVEGEKAKEKFITIMSEIQNMSNQGIDGLIEKILTARTDAYNYYFDEAFDDRKNIWESVKKAYDVLNDTSKTTSKSLQDLDKEISNNISLIEEYESNMESLASAYQTVSDGGKLSSSTLSDLIDKYPIIADYVNKTGDLTLNNGEKIKEAYEEERKALIRKLDEEKKSLAVADLSEEAEKTAEERIQAINAQLSIYSSELSDISQKEAEVNTIDWSDMASEVKNLASAYQTLNEGKQLDVDTMIQLIDKYPAVANAMANEGKLGKEQANVLKQLFDAKKSDYILTQKRTIANLQASADETKGVINNIQSQINAYKMLGQIMGMSAIANLATNALSAVLAKNQQEYNKIQQNIKQAQARINAVQNININTYGKSGSSSDNSNKALANELKQLEHKKAIGQLTSKQEYNWLVRINNRYRKNSDEQMDMEKRLYNAKKQMQADEEAANTKALQAAYKGIENKKSLGKMTSQQELRQLEQIRQKYKMTADERMELEIKIYNLKKSLKDEEISSINTLADAVTEALKQKYEEQRKLEEERINESIESWQKWEDKTVEAIQGEIDALDELAKKQDSENKRQEYENKRQQTELQLAYEKDDYNRTQLQKELNRLDKEEAERLAEEQREAKKKALEGRIEAVKGQSQATQERLKKELDKLGEKYEKLTDSFSLKAQAQKFIADSTQKQIVSLIKSYASDYEIAGNTIGDALYNGMKAKMDNISAYVDGVFGKIEAYQRQMANTANASADRFWASQNSPQTSQKQTASKSVTVQQTVNFNQPIESPVETRRQLDRTNQALAKQISNGI